MSIQWKDTVVTSKVDGKTVKARVLSCSLCHGETWHILRIGAGQHEHIQCVQCGVSFCDGSCQHDKEAST